MSKWKKEHPELARSSIVAEIPRACSDETAAVEFLEKQRWLGVPTCAHCDSVQVYQMKDASGGRNKRFLWRCKDCKRQFTVRVGTIFEDSKLPLRYWCYAYWRACSSKKGVAALEIQRHCQISYKAALFVLHRIRWGMNPTEDEAPMLDGVVEADETYVGGRPRYKGVSKRGRGTSKTPVVAVVQRHGDVRVRVVAEVSSRSLKAVLQEHVSSSATLVSDDLAAYKSIGKDFAEHHSVNHSEGEYSRPWENAPKVARGENIHSNTIEGFFSIVKRGIRGIYHAVSKKHLHRYMAEFQWRYNARLLNDGERTCLAIRMSVGKRLLYREPTQSTPSA